MGKAVGDGKVEAGLDIDRAEVADALVRAGNRQVIAELESPLVNEVGINNSFARRVRKYRDEPGG